MFRADHCFYCSQYARYWLFTGFTKSQQVISSNFTWSGQDLKIKEKDQQNPPEQHNEKVEIKNSL